MSTRAQIAIQTGLDKWALYFRRVSFAHAASAGVLDT